MRSMHVIGSREEGGVERIYRRLMRALVANGEEVLCVLRPSSALMNGLPEGVQVQAVRMRSIYDPFARARITSLARAFDAQIVQTYMGRATRLTRIETKSSKAVHVARVGDFHDLKGYRHASAWIASTDAICQYLIAGGMPQDRVFRVRNPVDEPATVSAVEQQALRAELGLHASHLVLICVGRLHRDRGVDVALDALARLPREHDGRELHLVVVGDGGQRATLQQQAEQLGVGERVHWVIGAGNPHPYATIADLLVYPSRQAAVGTAVLEAWSYGLTVVATSTAGPSEVLRDGESGFLVAVDDADALAQGIHRALQSEPAVRQTMLAAARLKLASEHSADAVAVAHVQVYCSLLA
jgi:glycosyltransferase involved in cell wall biosynthesis